MHCGAHAKVRLLPAAVHPQRHAMKQIQVRRKWMRAIWQEVMLDPHARAEFPSQ